MVFIRYSEGAKVYKMSDPGTGRVHTSGNIIFDESRGWWGIRRMTAATR
jgi:hypothetical protein